VNISVIIPAFNEEKSIGKVIREIPGGLINEIIVVNNNSSDDTEKVAVDAGATVLHESRQGYGAACLKGIEYLVKRNSDIVVFIDGDYSDFPEETELLVKPILIEGYDFVLGSRVMGQREPGSLPFHSIFGNIISGILIKLFWNVKYTDLGPFRAIKFDKLLQLNMVDQWYGWTVEMQIKAAKHNLKIKEVPVSYRKRIGKSKVSGTMRGSFMAGTIILKTIFVQLFKD
jgi:glycosyltransferase involved in cell wall biosynthesis